MMCNGAQCNCTMPPQRVRWYAFVEVHKAVHPHMLDRSSDVWLSLVASPSADWQRLDSLYCCDSSSGLCHFKKDTLVEIDMKCDKGHSGPAWGFSRPADSTGQLPSLRVSKQTQPAHVQHGAGILAGLKSGAASRYCTTF